MNFPTDQRSLFRVGVSRVYEFCAANDMTEPDIYTNAKVEWNFGHVCAYYRPDGGIQICLDHCGHACGKEMSRNWSWPGNTTDREPYGVLCHELGHYADYHKGKKKGTYFSEYGISVRAASHEKPISGYCDNDWEWFAEMFRVFVTNAALLKVLRPITYGLIRHGFKPVTSTKNWKINLGNNVPDRVVKAIENKIKKGK